MNTAILLVDSVTYAIKAQRVLKDIGIRAVIKKVYSDSVKGGCRYGVFFEKRYVFEAMAELSKKQISFERWREEAK